ncbi:putative immune-type receptor 12a precursor, partial [Clarias magur]
LLSETLCSFIFEAEPGDKVTIWCEHHLTDTGYISWFKHTTDSVPLLIECKKFRASAPAETCYFFTENKRIVMSVYGKNTSLTITAVHVSDTGHYYCGSMKLVKMTFSTSTSLQVKDTVNRSVNTTFLKDKATGSDSSAVFFWLNLMAVVMTAALFAVTFAMLTYSSIHR